MIFYKSGDIFDTTADIRINTVNCVGVMGAGIALAFKKRYPDMFTEYAKACKNGQVRPGKPHVWEKNTIDETVTIVNLPTKEHWKDPSEYEYISKGLNWLHKYLAKRGNVRVTIPALGSGHGGLNWEKVKPMISKSLGDLEAEIYIFDPSTSHAIGTEADSKLLAELKKRGIATIRPGDALYPKGLNGRSDLTLYVMGRTDNLTHPIVAFLPSVEPEEREKNALLSCVREIAKPDVTLLFGYSPNSEYDLIRAAIKQGANVIICIVEGILEFKIRKVLADIWDEQRITVVSGAKPTQRWFTGGVGRATRIKLVLSTASVITDPSPDWLKAFLKQRADLGSLKLFYLDYGSKDALQNELLKQFNAVSLGRNRETGAPRMDVVLSVLGKGSSIIDKHIDEFNALVPATDTNSLKIGDNTSYPKRLIEVDLPIKRISAHARREKSIRHGHISTLHIWWARRPLAACRAVLCASLWPDPADPLCPEKFRKDAVELISVFAKQATTDPALATACDLESQRRWVATTKEALDPKNPAHLNFLRFALLDFIADFANWDNSTRKEYLDIARALTQSAHEALGGQKGTRPLVVDPFAGGGAIPLEALRVGADAFASDLNPVAVLLNKVMLDYIPKHGQKLADEVQKWGEWIKKAVEKDLAQFYPKDPDGSTPIAYLWARTIRCEGPGCGAEIPLLKSMWLAHTPRHSVTLKMIPRPKAKRVDFKIVESPSTTELQDGTIRRASATCPCCGFTTHAPSVRNQIKLRKGGANDARLVAVVTVNPEYSGRAYRLATKRDVEVVKAASTELGKRITMHQGRLPLVPDEPTPQGGGSGAGRAFSQRNYGMDSFSDLFNSRQLLALTTIASSIHHLSKSCHEEDPYFLAALTTCLSLVLDRQANTLSSLSRWDISRQNVQGIYSRQAMPVVWDYAEANPLSSSTGCFDHALRWVVDTIIQESPLASMSNPANGVQCADASEHPLPDDSCDFFFTDPPYYDAVPYSDLSDFFFVWLKRVLPASIAESFRSELAPKEAECIVDEVKGKDKAYFEQKMRSCMAEGRRVLTPSGIGLVVFAHKSTAGWEAQLQALVDAGWTMTGSWPIDTEMGSRLRAMNSAALASSIHLVCRPRENPDGSVRTDEVGDWRDILQELPKRIHDWMPRLAGEGVVGADAIFACLGPALEVYSRYSRVEKASGEQVTLREYLEHVWAAVAEEALKMIFEGADAKGFEEDARLTAMWLWTLSTGNGGNGSKSEDDDGSEEKSTSVSGYTLEYDAARKIAQGLGAYLESLSNLVEIEGDKAVLLPVAARTRYLFGKDESHAPTRRPKKDPQLNLLASLQEAQEESGSWGEKNAPPAGSTVLDRIHQTMILFAANRGEAIKRFLVEDGIGKDYRFWKLAQALSALYPKDSDEKRWVDGVLGRKKSLGF